MSSPPRTYEKVLAAFNAAQPMDYRMHQLDLAVRAARDDYIDIVRNVMLEDPHLLDTQASPAGQWSGWTVMGHAARWGRLTIVQHLVDRGASVDAQCRDGYTPLTLACAGKHRNVVEFLLYKGADVNLRAKDGMTAISQARQSGPKEIFDLVAKVIQLLYFYYLF